MNRIRSSSGWRLAWLIFFVIATRPSESATFSTIITNGPSTNRVNLVLFSEGYTTGEFSIFLDDATNAANYFLSAEPYAEYSNYFNVFAIFTNSAHSGSTHLISQSYHAGYTYFNSSYDINDDYYITIPPNTTDAIPSHGQGEINSLLWTNCSQFTCTTVPTKSLSGPLLLGTFPLCMIGSSRLGPCISTVRWTVAPEMLLLPHLSMTPTYGC